MKIVIAGLTQVGICLAETLSKENHDVMVIDQDGNKVNAVTDRYNVSGVTGNCASKSTLLRAGVDTADVCVTLTPSDETNLCTCMMAKKCGTRYTVAKLDNPELTGEQKYYEQEFMVDYVLTPKEDTALEIARHIGLPGTVRADAFFSFDTTMFRVTADKENGLAGMHVKDIRNLFDTDMLVGTICRNGKLLIPDGTSVIEEKDEVYLIVPHSSMTTVMMKLGMMRKPVKNVLIIGGGDIARSLAGLLLENKKKVTILDIDRSRCADLAQILPQATISCAAEIDSKVLLEEGIDKADVCVSLTGRDDTNLVLSMFAWSCGVNSVITKVNSTTYESLLNRVNIDITISPVLISVERITGFIRNVEVPNDAGNDIACMYQIAGGVAEAIEFIAYDNFKAKDIPLKDKGFKLKKNLLIGMVLKDGVAVIPGGNTSIQPGDHVVVITKRDSGLKTLNDILS